MFLRNTFYECWVRIRRKITRIRRRRRRRRRRMRRRRRGNQHAYSMM